MEGRVRPSRISLVDGRPFGTVASDRAVYDTGFAILSSVSPSPILLGTSSFTATGWKGSFYPKGLRPADYLSYYAQHFDTVEIDSTFYATPNVSVVRSWNAKAPEGFLFAAKVPQEITHREHPGAAHHNSGIRKQPLRWTWPFDCRAVPQALGHRSTAGG